ncbi:protein-glutamine gamma-glutamyltransferase [mine drainage metagenome]|uniref:Protein-glutamine gamma-glutamyltransferase n=1 Tax=mine drainage metagenome TaxID=410659 RepID=A0A1J5RU16_9ZZZZ
MKLTAPLIYGLIACILLVSAPHAEHLPLWVSAICSALLAWRAYLTWSGNPLPPRWLLLVVTLACVLAIAATFRTLFGREVGVTLLILLASLKLLEMRAVRDVTVLIYLSCFVIITNFFYSQSIPTALFMLLTLLVIMATWVHMQTGDLAFRPRLRIAGILLLQAIPLSLVIFVLFPRVQGPLWGMPQDAYASSGLSDSMAPGSLSRLSLSDAVAFRVVFNGREPTREQLYWRGPVLWDFDGTSWKRGRNATLQRPVLTDATAPVDYTVTLEPHNKPWLFVLDMPAKISIPADLAPDFQVLNRTPVNARTRYSATSLLSYRANLGEPPQQLQRALALPQGYNPQARKLAAEWRTRSDSDMALVQTALGYFNRNGFEYTLEPPLLGTNSVDDFIFTTKKGFCEHYAGSFVFLMRAAGLPARVVTGYQGGEYNDLGGYYILRQYDAHAWAEVWLRDRGWVRIDPTAAIAPARIQSGLNAALPDNATLPFLARTQSPLLLKLRFNLDALTNQWNQWVLGYNTERQFAFLTRLGMEDITWKKLAVDMLSGVALLVGIFTLLMLRRLSVRQADAVQALWLKACRKLEKAGLPRAPHEGATDYAARIAAARPELTEEIYDLAARYASLRYGGEAEKDGLAAFRNAVRAFKL